MQKFVKRPVEIEAFQLQEDFFTPFVKDKAEKFKPKEVRGGEVESLESYIEKVPGFADKLYINVQKDKHTLFIKTLEGDLSASLGDWIIKGVEGEYYACKPDIFKKTYAPVIPGVRGRTM